MDLDVALDHVSRNPHPWRSCWRISVSITIKYLTGFRDSATSDPFRIVRSDHGCFGCGDDNPIGLHLRFAPEADGVKASFIPGPQHQGFQDVVHGGIISAVLDEAMAWATAHAGLWAVTGEMRVRFRQPLKLGELTSVVARVIGTHGRVVTAAAELRLERDRSPVATATATFIKVDADVEAAWRARYLRDPDMVTADLRVIPQDAAETSGEQNRVGPPSDDAFAPEVEF
jgi:acyl-coenzyme A thioesterase PaaI-like protein